MTHPTGPAGPRPDGDSGPGPNRILRAVGDYAALWLAIGRMTGVLLADAARDITADVRRQRHARNGGTS
jgi:hypothetical protein